MTGVHYVAADGAKIPDKGERKINVLTEMGRKKTMRFALAKVTKPLAAVGEMTEIGHRVVFDDVDPEGSYILDHRTNEKIVMRKEAGVYVVEMWVAPPDVEDQNPDICPFSRQAP